MVTDLIFSTASIGSIDRIPYDLRRSMSTAFEIDSVC